MNAEFTTQCKVRCNISTPPLSTLFLYSINLCYPTSPCPTPNPASPRDYVASLCNRYAPFILRFVGGADFRLLLHEFKRVNRAWGYYVTPLTVRLFFPPFTELRRSPPFLLPSQFSVLIDIHSFIPFLYPVRLRPLSSPPLLESPVHPRSDYIVSSCNRYVASFCNYLAALIFVIHCTGFIFAEFAPGTVQHGCRYVYKFHSPCCTQAAPF